MIGQALYFIGPGKLEIRELPIHPLAEDQIRVQTEVSAISPGTEMLIYRGQAPSDLATDDGIPALSGNLEYPLQYGYACVGRVVETGSKRLESWLEKFVFCFHPHQSLFNITADQALPIAMDMPLNRAALLPNMETAISLIHDGAPVLGERVVVFGQGVVGLLTTALLSRFPLALLAVIDPLTFRRKVALESGAEIVLSSIDGDEAQRLSDKLESKPGGADLVFELTGNPEVLNDAILISGYNGRIVVGSWYGARQAKLDLGGRFHRDRIQLISSQVSTIHPVLRGRWTKTRRLGTALRMLDEVQPENLVTHTFPIDRADDAYSLIDENPGDVIQVLLSYKSG